SLGENSHIIKRLYKDFQDVNEQQEPIIVHAPDKSMDEPIQEPEEIEESLSLVKKEIDFIRRALQKHDGKRKDAARELGISERTLYRKIKEYDIE
ncbi:MAG: sigma-54-dependent Fis family transcriptional regulator, partial [Bacteroidetes bacterium]